MSKLEYPYPTLEAWIESELKDDQRPNRDYGYHGNTPLGETWAIVYSYAPKLADLLDESNWEHITTLMLKRYPRQTTIESFDSWITKPIDHLMVQLRRKDGKPTKAAEFIYEKLIKLADYPIWDEMDFSEREFTSEQEYIESECKRYLVDDSKENWIGLIWEYLSDIGEQSENGAYDLEEMIAAGLELEVLDPDLVCDSYIGRRLMSSIADSVNRGIQNKPY